MTAVAYIRRSHAGEAQASESLQRETVARLAEQHGDTIAQTFRDWGRSGGSEDRPQYLAMLERIESGEVQTVYAYDSDRLARDIWLLSGLMRAAKRQDVRIYTAAGELTDDDTRTLHLMRGVMDDGELVKITKRNRATVAHCKDRGDTLGVAPYGFMVARDDAGRVVHVPNPDEPLQAVLDAYEAAGTYSGAAAKLNADGIRSKHGKLWDRRTVAGIVRRERPEAPVPGQGQRREHRPRLFARLLRCHCGGPMSPGKGSGGDLYYCGRGKRGAHDGPKSISEAKLRPWIEEEADRLRIPGDTLASEGPAYDDSPDRARLEAARDLIGEDAYREALERLEAAQDAHSERQAILQAIPPRIDWERESVEDINASLRAMWEHVELGPDLLPVDALWKVPEWRA